MRATLTVLRLRVRKLTRHLVDSGPWVILTQDADGKESAAFVGWIDRPCLTGPEADAWWRVRG